jgi:quinol monooxygenase YgiN
MYARMVQQTAKPGQVRELNRVQQERVLPILRQQAGFVDAIALVSDAEKDQFVGISIWKSKEDADKFAAGQAPQILQLLKPLLQSDPIVRSFNVEGSTSHNIGIGRAASST